MDFSFTDEQALLQDSVQRFIQNSYAFDSRQKLIKTEDGFSRENWASFAELGWLALPFSEESGGFGGTAVETMILMEEFGKGLVVEPYLTTVLMSGSIIEAGGSSAQKEGVLAEIMAGTKLAALAYVEPQARFNLADVTTTAAAEGDGYVINGFKGVVMGGPSADVLIVPARTAGEQRDEAGITLFLVDANSNGISKRDYPTIDGGRASEITLENVTVDASAVIGEVGGGFALLEVGINNGILGVCAVAVGAMEVLYKTTVEYCKTREQFGQPIGKFQVLQHRMVEVTIAIEQARSITMLAAGQFEADRLTRERSLSAAKNLTSRVARLVSEETIQLHGGIAMTWEYSAPHFAKRLTMIDHMLGDEDFHLYRFQSLEGAA